MFEFDKWWLLDNQKHHLSHFTTIAFYFKIPTHPHNGSWAAMVADAALDAGCGLQALFFTPSSFFLDRLVNCWQSTHPLNYGCTLLWSVGSRKELLTSYLCMSWIKSDDIMKWSIRRNHSKNNAYKYHLEWNLNGPNNGKDSCAQ